MKEANHVTNDICLNCDRFNLYGPFKKSCWKCLKENFAHFKILPDNKRKNYITECICGSNNWVRHHSHDKYAECRSCGWTVNYRYIDIESTYYYEYINSRQTQKDKQRFRKKHGLPPLRT